MHGLTIFNSSFFYGLKRSIVFRLLKTEFYGKKTFEELSDEQMGVLKNLTDDVLSRFKQETEAVYFWDNVALQQELMELGSNYAIIKDAVDLIEVSGNELLVPEDFDVDALTTWLKEQAMQIISERVALYANIMGITPGMVKLSAAKARWCSCSTKNNLNFTWRLIMCPLSVIDYVVVHELSHITYKNHSPAFWARVKTVLPSYEDDQEWLKVNRKLMEII